ncbi:MAG: Lin0512 family protein [Desulfovibrio sp.]|uniref:Lin0512 family protein n=1 Tax=Desulfovibrio sp. 7SRBS1 TaxID=3378064 RepID=UPI003B423110
MERRRYAIELGYGADLHGEDMTKAALRAVKDAMSRTCLCGLVEVHGRDRFSGVHVHVEVAVPEPLQVDCDELVRAVPIGTVSAQACQGGMRAKGLEVECFGPGCSDIVCACAVLTVYVDEK